MIKFIVRRMISAIPVLFAVSFIVFCITQLAPGDPVTFLVDDNATAEQLEEVRKRWGLDQPIIVQYGYFLYNAAQGDLGNSIRYRAPVADLIAQRLPATIELALVAMLFGTLIALPLGVMAGWRPNSKYDNIGSGLGLFGVSMPNFWFALMLILIFSGVFRILPSGGRTTFGFTVEEITGFVLLDSIIAANGAAFVDALRHMVLPAATLGLGMIGIVMRITRSSILEVSGDDYIRTAHAKGLSESRVVTRHALPNAMIPITTVLGLELGSLLSGSIIAETVFGWPGIGSLLIQSIYSRDFILVTAISMVFALIFVLINLTVDLLYALFDPRIRHS